MGLTDPPSPEMLAFDTDALPAAERMERYRALYGYGADITVTGPAPHVAFECWRLDGALLYHRRLNDIGHRRTAERVARDGMTHWTVTLVFEGSLAVDWGEGWTEIGAGELLLLDVSHATINKARHARIATLSIAGRRIGEVIGSLDGLHGLVLAPSGCRLYADFVQSLFANLPTMNAQTLPAATSALCTLLKVALDAHGHRYSAAAPGGDGARLARLRSLIDARFGDPRFDADRAIVESGLSRATLYRLMRPHRGLARYIQARRLDYIRRALSDPDDTRSLAAICTASGFTAESYASRAFLAHYGLRPGKYRTITTTAPTVDTVEQFRSWQHDLIEVDAVR